MNGPGDHKFELLMPYYKRVRTFFLALGFTPEDSRDLVQDVFLRVYEHVDGYRSEAKWSYLQKIARNIATNAIRDRHALKRTAIMETEEKLDGMRDDRVPPADKALADRQTSDWLHRAVNRLDLKQRPCMRLYLEDFSYDEIAQSLGLSVSAVKSRLNLARKRLQEMVGDDLEDFGDEP